MTSMLIMSAQKAFINPQHACAARLTVLALVCWSAVCYILPKRWPISDTVLLMLSDFLK